jgi:hypothetical protein
MTVTRARLGGILAMAAAVAVTGLVVLSSGVGAAPPPGPGPTMNWHRISTTVAPGPRDRLGMAYDPTDGYTVLYGGYNYLLGTPFYYDTWAYSAGVWTDLNLSTHPPAPSGFQMAYFPPLHGVVLFGGECPYGGCFYNQTWLFKGGVWTQLHPKQSPPARSQYAMAYDAATKNMVLFGGTDGGNYLQDTWVFTGKTWKEVSVIIAPPGRYAATMVYDPASKEMLLFGGYNNTFGPTPGTWAFKSGVWWSLSKAKTPSRTWTPAATLPNGTPIFFGGLNAGNSTVYNSSYEFYGGSWHAVVFGSPPAPRTLGGLAYDAADGYTLDFGGVNPNTAQFYNDTNALY